SCITSAHPSTTYTFTLSLHDALPIFALFDSKEVKVLEQGVMFFKDLVRVREKYGLEKWAFEIQRHGAAKDPKTTYSILPEHQLRSEEHTSELQSRENLVCRLLLEKKK